MHHKFNDLKKKGLVRMRESSVAICGLIRNNEKALLRNIPKINKLLSLFNSGQIIIVENDSCDGTKSILKNWQAQKSGSIHLIMYDYGVETIPRKIGSSNEKSRFFSEHRIAKMSFYRNLYMDFLAENIDADFVIVIDLDIYSLSISGICSSFGYEDWDAISANGRKLTWSNPFYPCYYDTYALLQLGERLPLGYSSLLLKQKKYSRLKLAQGLIPVRSAFGGLCIYTRKKIHGLRYEVRHNDDNIIQCLCEHMDLHLKMEKLGHSKQFINPYMRVSYENPILKALDLCLKKKSS